MSTQVSKPFTRFAVTAMFVQAYFALVKRSAESLRENWMYVELTKRGEVQDIVRIYESVVKENTHDDTEARLRRVSRKRCPKMA
jgi:hypothetical protein